MERIRRYNRQRNRRVGAVFWKSLGITVLCVILVAAGYFLAMVADFLLRML